MKRFFILFFILFFNSTFYSQAKQYVSWSYSQKKISADEFELIFKAKIEPTWHLYSQIETPDGPLPTSFEFEKSKDYVLVGKTIEPAPIEHAEPVFDNLVVRYFENAATFKQKIKVKSKTPFTIKGFIDGMACNESQCQKFSPSPEFIFKIEGSLTDTSNALITEPKVEDSINASATNLNKNLSQPSNQTDNQKGNVKDLKPEPSPQKKSNTTYISLFIAGFLGGLLALLTPCVFPMIPMTVSFFTKQSKTKAAGIRNAIIYSISIIIIYILLGLGVTLIFGADAMNNLATNVWFNLAFFVLLVVFGLLVQAASTGALAGPFFGMFGFSLALALPFGLFAAFPGWLNSLPKSGGWLNSVKVVLGFLELALAMKFLSNADLVYDAMIITREVFLVSWIVIFGLLGAYLMGWFKLAHDSEMKFVSVPRLMMAIITFMFTFYLIPGLWGAPLSIINGFPPPLEYTEAPDGFGGTKSNINSSNSNSSSLPKHMHNGPNGIPAFDDYYFALDYSKKVGKPIMIDFTGKACINCRKMEAEVWSNPEVKRKLSEDFVLVSLYVDKKNELPLDLQKEVLWNGSSRKLKSVGDRWSYLQNTKYQSSTQPQYWIIDGDENHFSDSSSYDSDIDKYIEWLDKGLGKFKNKKK